MRLYHRPAAYLADYVRRCERDLDHGWVRLGLERLRDLADEFPGNAHVVYAEGLARQDFLGQGVQARALFQEAYSLALRDPTARETAWFAACNARQLARDANEVRGWTRNVRTTAPPEEDDSFGTSVSAALESELPYWQLLWGASLEYLDHQNLGKSAALLEIALQAGGMSPEEELEVHLHRAISLRQLDGRVMLQRDTLGEVVPQDELLTLPEALRELDQALAIDEFDAKLWNYRAAWCHLLGLHEEAVQSADRAIALRPCDDPHPHLNKARALARLGRTREAIACLEALVAQPGEAGEEIRQARDLLTALSSPSSPPGLATLERWASRILGAAEVAFDQETGAQKGGRKELAAGLLRRTGLLRGAGIGAYVPLMAEMLCDFSPETACCGLRVCRPEARQACLLAALEVAVLSRGVQRRDAARFVILHLFEAAQGSEIRKRYEELVRHQPDAAAILREELARMRPELPALVTDPP